MATLTGHSGQVVAVAYSPDDRLVATGATDGTARVWSARSGRQILVLRGHNATVDAIQFTPDSRRLVTAGEDGTARVWNITREGSRDWLTLARPRGRSRRRDLQPRRQQAADGRGLRRKDQALECPIRTR